MKKLAILGATLGLAACQPLPSSLCVNPGIDLQHPNFYQAPDYVRMDAYFGCIYQNADKSYSDEPFRSYRWSGYYLRQDAQYQWNLWRQVYGRLKQPIEAEQLWLEYYNAQTMSRAQLEATKDASYQAQRSADAVESERYSRQRKEDKAKKDRQQFPQPDLSGVATFPVKE